MRPNRVYPVVVSWQSSGRAAEPVVVRLVMAGAQVVPAEQPLAGNDPDGKTTFYVTPLAKGQLRAERLEVLQDGKKVQEIKLPCKVTTQCLTWCLVLLTVLVCWWIVPLFDTTPAQPPLTEFAPPENPAFPEAEQPRKLATRDAVGVRLSRDLRLPEALPLLKQHLPQVAKGFEEAPYTLGDFYLYLWATAKQHRIPLAEIITGVMLLLTLLSWWFHLERRKRRVGKPLPAVAGGDYQE
jgi:hypothetical protein